MDPILQAVERALAVVCERKRRRVATDGVGSDVVAMLDLRHEGVMLGVLGVTGNDRADAFSKISLAIMLSDADRVLFISEGYRQRMDDDGPRGQAHGELARRFAAGDESVAENIQVYGFERDGSGATAFATYRYRGRQVDFDPVRSTIFEPGDGEGAIVEAVTIGFDLQAKRVGPAYSTIAIGRRLEWAAVIDVPSAPRNGPCPCGSGRKAKSCCWAS